MSIQREFVLRYRADGHVRFQIPARACGATNAKAITEGIVAIDGVYRVNLYRRQQKLSIHFQESICDFKALAKQLFSLLAELDRQGIFIEPTTAATGFSLWKEKAKAKLNSLKATRWAKEKVDDAKETIQAAKIITKLGSKKSNPFISEKAIIDFLNDILVLFLIKLHWTHITQQWLLKPIKYRYELLAMVYMFYLLVRARKKK